MDQETPSSPQEQPGNARSHLSAASKLFLITILLSLLSYVFSIFAPCSSVSLSIVPLAVILTLTFGIAKLVGSATQRQSTAVDYILLVIALLMLLQVASAFFVSVIFKGCS